MMTTPNTDAMLSAAPAPEPVDSDNWTLGSKIADDIGARQFAYGTRANAIAGTAARWPQMVADLQAAHALDGERQDVTGVDLRGARLRSDAKRLYLQTDVGEFPMREHAFAQLCSAIGAPAQYLATLQTRTALKALAWGLHTKPIEGKRTLRLAGGELRAIVTGRYRVRDDLQVIALVEHALIELGQIDKVQCERLYVGKRTGLRFSVGKPVGEHDASTGLGSRPSIGVGNGELGTGSTWGLLGLYVPWCTNGCSFVLKGRAGFRLTHLAEVDETDFVAHIEALISALPMLTGLTKRAAADAFDLASLQARIDALPGTSASQRRAVMRQTLAEAYGLYPTVETVDGEAIKQARAVELELRAARKGDERERIADDIAGALGRTDCFNAWQLCQGVTAVARDSGDTAREHLEAVGGSVLASYL